MWLLLVLLPAAALPARGCRAPGEAAVRVLSARLLGLAAELGLDADPGVYVGLRLAGEHDLRAERRYLERLRDTFQGRYGRSLESASHSSHGHRHRDAEHSTDTRAAAQWPETGRLALYLLGLRATCPPPDPSPQRFLVTWLKYYLEKDWEGSRRHGHPLTSYYQYSLGVLALCVHRKRVREEVIQRLLVAEQHRRFRHAGSSTVDTEAVAALAFACLEREQLVRPRLAAELRAAVRGIRARFVAAQSEDGFIGNVFSTPLAMQVFIATNRCRTQPAYGRATAALLQRLDAFTSAAAMAQALPVLHGRSYLDIASMQCKEELDTLTPLALEPLPVGPGNMMVRLVVECPVPLCPQHLLYDLPVPVPTGASLLDLLGAAPAQGPQNFTFETQDTPQGPFLTSVLGLAAQPQERHYWQLLGGLGTSLQMGVADYRPEDGETVVLRLSKW
ncbi:transcobalamin-2 [Cygnus atratus]|uniref:transcobalamin-2 n=1 Tax=Cygnus atratus TaxID=8868 RepID=UPI0015D5FA0C|nr:transcobalamin-2 [Cygnus atratus]